jgi:short-chain fatty acids transporter
VKTEEKTHAGSWLALSGLRLSNWFERWFPDAFALALVGVIIVYVACVAIGNSPIHTAQWFGAGFWDLVAFTMQMTMIIISGYALATAPPVYAVIRRMAAIPQTPKSAAAFVALFSMLSSLISWSFSLIFSGLLAREVAHRVRGSDFRAIGAAGYLGVGSVWALGLSSSAALLMAAPASLPQSIQQISGVIPLSQTLGLWQGMLIAAVLIVASMFVAVHSHPTPEYAREMQEMGVRYEPMIHVPLVLFLVWILNYTFATK